MYSIIGSFYNMSTDEMKEAVENFAIDSDWETDDFEEAKKMFFSLAGINDDVYVYLFDGENAIYSKIPYEVC